MSILACKSLNYTGRTETHPLPASFNNVQDSLNSAQTSWKMFFKDSALVALIDSALQNNQELNITLQEIERARNEIRARKSSYLPSVNTLGAGGFEKVGRYTSQGASDAGNQILPGKTFPETLPDYTAGIEASWQLDIWHQLRNAKKSAVHRYLASVEGKNFIVTRLIAEIANSYYELVALDNQLEILKNNIEIQQSALETVKLEKDAAKVTELAVRKFEAEVMKNQSRQFYIAQQITETENRINFLVGRFPQTVNRNARLFTDLSLDSMHAGIPAQLLINRPDIRKAEQELTAARLDVKVARAEFYPKLAIAAGIRYRAFNPRYLLRTPESLAYNLAGNLSAPLVNRNAIKANLKSASARQVQALYNYEQTLLRAYIEVVNQLSNIKNLKLSYDLKEKQVQALTQSTYISSILFKSARADYMEVLLTQRDALDSKFELIETKKQQMNALINVYQALGGGWR